MRDAGFPRLSARDRHRLVLTQALMLYIHRKGIDQILDEQVRRVLGPDVDLVDRLVVVLGLLLFDALLRLLLVLCFVSSQESRERKTTMWTVEWSVRIKKQFLTIVSSR